MSCSYVLHVASPFMRQCNDPQKELIDPALQGTKNVLESALKCGVKKIIVTSSCAAVTKQSAIEGKYPDDYVWTEKDWNDESTLENGAYRYVVLFKLCFFLF